MNHISLDKMINNVRYLQDYTKGSLLLLLKDASHPPTNQRFEILMFELETGLKTEYLNIMIDNPDYDAFSIYDKGSNLHNIELLKEQYKKLPKNHLGIVFYP